MQGRYFLREDTRMKEKTKSILKSHFSATHIAYMALFTALAFAVTFLEFPIFPATPFLKFDFANVFFLFEGFIFGPVEAIVSIGIKELLCLTKSSSGGVGEIANFIMSTAYVIVPSVAYRFKKGRMWVALYLVIACVVQVGASLIVNRYINFPFYGMLFGFDGVEFFQRLWPFVIYFNLIKSVGISVIVLIIYKPLARVVRLTAQKFSRQKGKARIVKLHLAETPFQQIAGGEKTVEVRLNTKKRKKIQIGDTLVFWRKEEKKKSVLRARVVALHPYMSFVGLFSVPDIKEKAGFGGMTDEEAAESMGQYYTKKQEEKYGVLGIEIELIS